MSIARFYLIKAGLSTTQKVPDIYQIWIARDFKEYTLVNMVGTVILLSEKKDAICHM